MGRALISVSDKEGLIPFAQGLMEIGIELIATPGTLKCLQEAGILAVDISNIIGMPSILSGRLKTLHPKIHGGIVADRDKAEHVTQMRNLGLVPIDIVVVNMGYFSQNASFDEFMETIDIGGPALIRSAASNYKHILIVSNPDQYPAVLKRLKTQSDDEQFRSNLAAIAFSATARYDALIASYMAAKLHTQELFPSILPGHYIRESFLRSGENEHQKAAFYRNLMSPINNLGLMKQLSGLELTGSHMLNIDAAWELVSVFKKPSVAIVKHCIPVGISVQNTLVQSFDNAYNDNLGTVCGGVIAFNRVVDEITAKKILEKDSNLEGIIAPGYQEKVVDILKSHPVWGENIKILEMPTVMVSREQQPTLRTLSEGVLLEESDEVEGEPTAWRIVTRAKPREKQLVDMAFGLAVASLAKSAAAVVAKDSTTLGIGIGQVSSLEGAAVAISKAGPRSRDAVLALDEPCNSQQIVRLAYEAGIAAIIQPRDNSKATTEVIAVANELGIPIIFCKNSHYRY